MSISYDCFTCKFSVTRADWDGSYGYSASVNEITRVAFSTKEPWQIPYSTVDSIGKYGTKEQVLAGTEERIEPTAFSILRFDAE